MKKKKLEKKLEKTFGRRLRRELKLQRIILADQLAGFILLPVADAERVYRELMEKWTAENTLMSWEHRLGNLLADRLQLERFTK
jgi:hypothetical protein